MSKSDNTSYKKPISTDFSDGFYDWSIFIINLYLRVQQILKIDYESFMILQIVVGYHVSNLNKTGSSSISQLTFRFEEIVNKSSRYISIGSSVLEPILKAELGVDGVRIASTFLKD